MLQTLRDKSQGIVAIVIIAIIALTFALWGIHNYFGGGGASKPVAKVNGHKITEQAFRVAFQRFRQIQMQQNPQLFASQKSVNLLKQHVLQSLIDTSLLTQSATRQGFAIGQEQLMLALAKLPEFQMDGQFSKMRFEQFLSSMMFSQQQFFSSLMNTMKLAQVRTGFINTSFVLPYQVDQAYRLINQKRTFSYLIVPTKKFLSQVHLAPNAIEQYYQQHLQQFTIPEKVNLEYLELSLPALMQVMKPTQTQLQSYYENNINHFTIPKHWELAHILVSLPTTADAQTVQAAKQKADRIASQLKQDKTFSALAAKYSDDLTTAKQGGKMKPITLLEVGTTWQHQILSLKNPGNVSAPFRSGNGFEIIKLINTKAAVIKPYDQVKTKVLQNYRQEKAEKEFSTLSDQLSNITFEHPNTLKPAAAQLNIPIQTTGFFDKQGGDTKLLKNAQLLHAAFSNDVLNNGNNSDAIQLNDQSVLVLRVKEKVLAKVKPLTSVKNTISEKLKQQQALKLAQQTANKILQQVNAGKLLQSIDHGFVVQTAHEVLRNRTGRINPAIVAAAFSMGKPQKETPAAQVTSIGKQGVAVVALDKVQDGMLSTMSVSLKREFATGVKTELGELDYLLYQQGLRNKANIKYYTKESKS